MITITNLRLQRGTNVLLEKANARIDTGQKVGLVGRNGAGKSSLFALLRGELLADEGDVSIPTKWTVAHVAQEMPDTDESALDYVLGGDAELTLYNAQLDQAMLDDDGEAMGTIFAEMTRIDAYSAPSRAAQLLNGLGFAQHLQNNEVTSFSGGWRMRLNLARALMCRSDLLLLDEPTNHLDLDTVLWLEDYLKSHPATLIIISHDRDFLDALCTHVIETASQTLTTYKGNYSQYERTRAERLLVQSAMYEQQQRKAAHLQSYIDRFRAQATKARQAQSRIKALDKLQLSAPAHADSAFSFEFAALPDLPNPQIQADHLDLGYGDSPLLKGAKFTIQSQDRIGLLGMNGAGKSTLIKALAGELTPLKGEIVNAPNLRIGYFSQQHLDTLRENESPMWHMIRIAPTESPQKLRGYLGGFNFSGDRVNESILNFSGGEKARLALALLIWTKPHLLLLDEPTNHLDLDMRHALVMALQQFDGALIVVSHDRSLLANCVDEFWLVADQTVTPFDGDLDDYRAWCARSWQLHKQTNHAKNDDSQKKKKNKKNAPEPIAAAPVVSGKSRATIEFEQKNLSTKISKLEKQMSAFQTELEQLTGWLSSDEAYAPENAEDLDAANKRSLILTEALAPLEEEWLGLQAELDALS